MFQVCNNRSGEINPTKIRDLVEGYIKKVKYYKKKENTKQRNNEQEQKAAKKLKKVEQQIESKEEEEWGAEVIEDWVRASDLWKSGKSGSGQEDEWERI